MAHLQPVHVRVNDAATGKPTPCRVRFTDAQGRYFAPYGRLTEFATSAGADVGGNLQLSTVASDGTLTSQEFAYIDGSCEIALPPGLIHVAICKGPEYLPVRQQLELTAGKLALRFTLQRWSDVRQQGWRPGDTRCHFLSPHAALLEGAAEDLDIVNLLACQATVYDDKDGWADPVARPAFSNLLAVSGQHPAIQRGDTIVVVNTHNTHPRLGSLALLNCHRVVYPLDFGWSHRGGHFENWTLADWCDQCHRKAGLVIWTATDMSSAGRNYGENLADAILGKVDAVEVEQFNWKERERPWPFDWYDLLQCGVRLPLVGGSGKDSNSVALGSVRTYAHLLEGEELSYKSWIEAVRAGRTFASNGPLLTLTVDGEPPGAAIMKVADQTLHIRAEAKCFVQFERLELIVNGQVAAYALAQGDPFQAQLELDIAPSSGWLAVRCWGSQWLPGHFMGQRVYAHTSPVYVRVPGQPTPFDRDAGQRLSEHLAQMTSWVDSEGRFENDAQRQRLRNVLEDAMTVLKKRAPD